jgi:hypothetical protein
LTQAGNPPGKARTRGDWIGLGLVLCLALAHGILYVLVVPPWQHYDEPTHFEYVRLLAERVRLPDADTYDLTMRREIAASMQAFGFWRDAEPPGIAFLSETPPSIGLSELRHPPLYYLVLALPQRLVMHQTVEVQLLVARATSLLFFLITVMAAYGLTRELFPNRRWLAPGVAAVVALFPTFTDLASAVNNDVGAAAATSLFLWGMARVLRHGWSWRRAAVLAGLTLAAAATKTTALMAIGFAWAAWAGIALIPWRRLGWRLAPLLALLIAGLLYFLDLSGQPAGWYISVNGTLPNQAVRLRAPAVAGQHVMRVTAGGERRSTLLQQELPVDRGQALRGKPVTLGVWLRAAATPAPVAILQIYDGETTYVQRVVPTTEWQFHTLYAQVPPNAAGVRARFLVQGTDLKQVGTVYLDGAVLVPGEWPADASPTFQDSEAQSGTWDGRPFDNWLHNGSGEKAWVTLPLWLGLRSVPYGPWQLADVWNSFWEWQRTAWVYWNEVSLLFQSFWGRFAWHHISLPQPVFYALLVPALLGAVGLGLFGVRLRGARPTGQRRAFWLMFVVWSLAWATTILRIHPVFVTGRIFYPAARYATVVIVPGLLFLSVGLLELFPTRWRWAGGLAGVVGLVVLDAIAVWGSILPYYYASP